MPATVPAGGAVPTRSWITDFVLLAAIWGSSFLFMRMATVEFGPLPTAGVRVAIAAASLLPLLWLRGLAPVLRRQLAADLRGRPAQLGHSIRLLRVRAAGDHHRPVGDPQRHRAPVRRRGGVAVAEGPAHRFARAGPGDRLRGSRAAGLGPGQLQARCVGHRARLGRAGLPAGHHVLRRRGQRHQALPERFAGAGDGRRQPDRRDDRAGTADAVVLAARACPACRPGCRC